MLYLYTYAARAGPGAPGVRRVMLNVRSDGVAVGDDSRVLWLVACK